jgi:RNA polymerase sigma-70 factor, ECF subfamily
MTMERTQASASEAELIKRVCDGDREAFYELVRPHERLVYAIAFSVLKNPADAEDAAQEAVLKAFSHLKSFRGESKFSTWLVQITYNEAKMKLRNARPHLYESLDEGHESEEGDHWPKDFADWRPIPSELLEESEVRKALENAINLLGPIYRDVLILRDINGLSVKETMAILGLSISNVKSRLHRARLQLRDSLAPGMDGCWSAGRSYRKVRPW